MKFINLVHSKFKCSFDHKIWPTTNAFQNKCLLHLIIEFCFAMVHATFQMCRWYWTKENITTMSVHNRDKCVYENIISVHDIYQFLYCRAIKKAWYRSKCAWQPLEINNTTIRHIWQLIEHAHTRSSIKYLSFIINVINGCFLHKSQRRRLIRNNPGKRGRRQWNFLFFSFFSFLQWKLIFGRYGRLDIYSCKLDHVTLVEPIISSQTTFKYKLFYSKHWICQTKL